MRAILEKVSYGRGHTFQYHEFRPMRRFDCPFHYHPEIELTLIVSSTGHRYVGDHIGRFATGDLVLMGPNLPHSYMSDERTDRAGSIVLQFLPECLGTGFFKLGEMRAIHALLERYGHLRTKLEPDEALRELDSAMLSIVGTLRGGGLARAAAESLATQALAVVRRAAADPDGAWILAPHPEAENEARWTGLTRAGARRPSNLRPDRVFLAAKPGEDQPTWWIVDYKTADVLAAAGEAEMLAFRQEHRARYAPRLDAYAQVLRGLHPGQALRIRLGIFYPRLPLLDVWIPEKWSVDGANVLETSSTNS